MKTDLLGRLGAAWLLTVAAGVALLVGCRDAQPERNPAPPGATSNGQVPEADGKEDGDQAAARTPRLPAGVPAKVGKVLRYIDEHQRAPEGYEGGRPFGNHEELLPKQDARGRPIKYREWDVNPKMPGKNRGPERLVTGSDGNAYYTPDHYRSFIKIR
jgi:ribonuclease T1